MWYNKNEKKGNFVMLTGDDVLKKLQNDELNLLEAVNNGWLCSVTQRINHVKQPRGGYLKPKEFEQIKLKGGIEELNQKENISPALVGLAVDYLTRFMSGTPLEEAFSSSKEGAIIVKQQHLYEKLLSEVKGLDDNSILATTKIVGFDSAYRAGLMAFKPIEFIYSDAETMENIRTMVNRSLCFLNQFGPKVWDGITFEGGFTGFVASGDGDFLTEDTLWDFKVSKKGLTSKQTLQVFMYWRMGLHSIHPEYKKIKYLGIYNPRLNVTYRYEVANIPNEIISEVETVVIGY